jgi:hypothetical protein
MKVPPLTWPNEKAHPKTLDQFLRGVPLVGPDARAHRAISRMLKRDRRVDCLLEWGTDPKTYCVVAVCSCIIREYFNWPNVLFLPDDPCQILFWNPSEDLHIEEATCVISETFQLRGDPFHDLSKITYGTLINRIVAQAFDPPKTVNGPGMRKRKK